MTEDELITIRAEAAEALDLLTDDYWYTDAGIVYHCIDTLIAEVRRLQAYKEIPLAPDANQRGTEAPSICDTCPHIHEDGSCTYDGMEGNGFFPLRGPRCSFSCAVALSQSHAPPGVRAPSPCGCGPGLHPGRRAF